MMEINRKQTQTEAESDRIASLIALELSGAIRSDEKEELDRWMENEEVCPGIYQRIAEQLSELPTKPYASGKQVEEGWRNLYPKLVRKKKQGNMRQFFRYAAVVVLGVGLAFFMERSFFHPSPDKARQEVLPAIKPGISKAILTLSSGEKLFLDHNHSFDFRADGITIERQPQGLVYWADDTLAPEGLLNTITVPRGGEFNIKLSDGTTVWLNSESEITYPVYFSGDSRRVTIRGEAFFEVAHQDALPFIVKTAGDYFVHVKGTSFNVSAYEDNPHIVTTLLTGKVEIEKEGKMLGTLAPNQQAAFCTKEGTTIIRQVDAYAISAWREGKFNFENQRLEEIMKAISRWYDIQVTYQDEQIKHICFTGNLERYDDFSTSLKMLEKVTRIQFKIENKNVTISRM